jgi:ABC-type transport system involved in multi-copper enzyme maturation permease subunit
MILSVKLAQATFREGIRAKALSNVLLLALGLFGVGYLIAQASVLNPVRMILNFGIAAQALSCAILGMALGGASISRDLERRTAWVVLSRPISKLTYVVSRALGVFGVVILNGIALALVHLALLTVFGSEITLSLLMTWTLGIAQGLLAAAIAMIFSSFSTATESALLTFGLFVLGNVVSDLKIQIIKTFGDGWLRTAFSQALTLLPRFEYFQVSRLVIYDVPMTFQSYALTWAYAVVWVGGALFVSAWILERRRL